MTSTFNLKKTRRCFSSPFSFSENTKLEKLSLELSRWCFWHESGKERERNFVGFQVKCVVRATANVCRCRSKTTDDILPEKNQIRFGFWKRKIFMFSIFLPPTLSLKVQCHNQKKELILNVSNPPLMEKQIIIITDPGQVYALVLFYATNCLLLMPPFWGLICLFPSRAHAF